VLIERAHRTKKLQAKFDEFKTASVDEEADGRVEQILEEWERMDNCVQSTLMKLQNNLRKVNGNYYSCL
jgi:uncharacterized protein YecA (UPF0149 family)